MLVSSPAHPNICIFNTKDILQFFLAYELICHLSWLPCLQLNVSGKRVISSSVREQSQEFGCILEFIPGMVNFKYKKRWKERQGRERGKNPQDVRTQLHACVHLFVLFSIITGYHSWAQWRWYWYREKSHISLDLNSLLVGNYQSLVKLFNFFQYKFSISKISINFTKGFRDYEDSG